MIFISSISDLKLLSLFRSSGSDFHSASKALIISSLITSTSTTSYSIFVLSTRRSDTAFSRSLLFSIFCNFDFFSENLVVPSNSLSLSIFFLISSFTLSNSATRESTSSILRRFSGRGKPCSSFKFIIRPCVLISRFNPCDSLYDFTNMSSIFANSFNCLLGFSIFTR